MSKSFGLPEPEGLRPPGEPDPLSLEERVKDHPPTDQCPDMECIVCGYRDCPHGEPLHYHHDGCPCCSFDEKEGSSADSDHQ